MSDTLPKAFTASAGVAAQVRLDRAAGLEVVEIFEEQQPVGLYGVIPLGRATGLLSEDVVDVLEGLFKHGGDECTEPGAGANPSTHLRAAEPRVERRQHEQS